jgi:hypothetical protein
MPLSSSELLAQPAASAAMAKEATAMRERMRVR